MRYLTLVWHGNELIGHRFLPILAWSWYKKSEMSAPGMILVERLIRHSVQDYATDFLLQ